MQNHPNPKIPAGAPTPDSVEHRVQRWVLLELVTTPPHGGDEISRLALGLDELRPQVEAAVDALVDVGLAERDGETVRASAAAWRFEALWRTRG
jgi:hypothetical protein